MFLKYDGPMMCLEASRVQLMIEREQDIQDEIHEEMNERS
jgi:hypothetical protein